MMLDCASSAAYYVSRAKRRNTIHSDVLGLIRTYVSPTTFRSYVWQLTGLTVDREKNDGSLAGWTNRWINGAGTWLCAQWVNQSSSAGSTNDSATLRCIDQLSAAPPCKCRGDNLQQVRVLLKPPTCAQRRQARNGAAKSPSNPSTIWFDTWLPIELLKSIIYLLTL